MQKELHIRHLRYANKVAIQTKENGHHPFGAILVGPDGETVILEHGNEDTVNHAESLLARLAYTKFDSKYLWDCTLYTTIEPCAMCSATQYWANIGNLVYGVSETHLLEVTGSDPENPTMDLPCRIVFEHGQKPIQVYGPYVEVQDEIMAVHQDFWKK